MPDSDLIQNGSQNADLTSLPLQLLIVEDVPEDVELIVLALESAGVHFRHDTAETLEQCRDRLANTQYHAILADYRLPKMQAPDVFELLLQWQPATPFILVTGSLGEESAVECIRSGMTDYVLKDRLYRLPTVLHRALTEADLKQQQAAAIAQIEQQAWRESILNRIMQAMRETLVLEEVLQTTTNQLHAALKVDRCLLVQPDRDQNMRVQVVSAHTADAASYLHQTCNLCRYYDAELRAGQQIILSQTQSPLSPQIANFLEDNQIASAMITPLNYQQAYFGVITLHQCQHDRQWSPSELSLVKAVADQCAIATSQAQLYEQAQKELEQRRRIEDQLRYDAFHDSLTHLPNRALFLDRLNHALQIAHRRQDDGIGSARNFAVLFLDLDDFRIVNDSLGHDAGDFLLRVVADRLSQCLRPGDTLARTSGDEFAVLLEDITGIDDITDVVENIQNSLKQPITLDAQELIISACIGIVLNTASYSSAAQFLRDADTAMYQAKAQGRGCYQVFDGSMHTQVKQRLKLENDLWRALQKQEFRLVYQPIVYLPTQRVCGFESLIRWQDAKRGLLSPEHFIPLAEQTGMIRQIGQWVLTQACHQFRAWRQQWPQMAQLRVSVNLSARQFAQPNLIDLIDEVLRDADLTGANLRLEVTESALIEGEETALETLRQLRDRQIQVAMDDFGTGYSSLSYLLRFPKDVLKIDKSFVSHLEASPDNQIIIKTILALGHNLGLEIVAEGIETPQQAEFLRQHGCLFGQGYWFYRPMDADAIERLLAAQFGDRPDVG